MWMLSTAVSWKLSERKLQEKGISPIVEPVHVILDVEVGTYSLYQRPSLAVIVLHAGNLTDNGWYGKVYTSLFFVHPSILHFLF